MKRWRGPESAPCNTGSLGLLSHPSRGAGLHLRGYHRRCRWRQHDGDLTQGSFNSGQASIINVAMEPGRRAGRRSSVGWIGGGR
jgi:hypothetical protein